MASPYENRPPRSFWRSAVAESHPLTATDLYRKKFAISAADAIATAGSCFAQHVARHLRSNAYSVLDVEPAPQTLDEERRKEFGYGLYSARYGNIYNARQLLQLAEDAESGFVDPRYVWTKDGRFYDALRPNVEPNGFESLDEALELRRHHLGKVSRLFAEMNLFIFTFGLTETWADRETGRVFPSAPGTIAGEYDPALHVFHNLSFEEVRDDFLAFRELVRKRNPSLRMLLTISPVPLTATAGDEHALAATTYSKSVLRAVAGELAARHEDIDYFPSYEIIASPWSRGFFYEPDLRSVSEAGVQAVMRVFFRAHRPNKKKAGKGRDAKAQRQARRRERGKTGNAPDAANEQDAICEDILLEAFAP